MDRKFESGHQHAPKTSRQSPQPQSQHSDAPDPVLIQRAIENPDSLTPEVVQMIQTTHGNRFAAQLIRQQSNVPPIQAKLTVGAAGDHFEQEADQVAQEVVNRMQVDVQRQPEDDELQFSRLQRQPEEDDELPIQGKFIGAAGSLQRGPEDDDDLQFSRLQRQPDDDELQFSRLQRQPEDDELQFSRLQRQPDDDELQFSRLQRGPEDDDDLQFSRDQDPLGNTDVMPELESQIQSTRGTGSGLPGDVRRSMEQAFGADFSGVHVHADPQADALNRSLQARAFTIGSDIFFRQGDFNPGSTDGQLLLAHELTHTIQQGASGVHRSEVIQRKTVNEEGYSSVRIADYFVSTHLASDEEEAKRKSIARGGQWGRGMGNTVISGSEEDVAAAFKAADYDSGYNISGSQWGVKLTDMDYWKVEMLAGGSGYTVSEVSENNGDVYVKAYFNRKPNATVSGVDG